MEGDKIGTQLETAGAFPLDRKMYFNSFEDFNAYPNDLKFDGMLVVIRSGQQRGAYLYEKATNTFAPAVLGVTKVLYIANEGLGDIIDHNVVYGTKQLRKNEITDGTAFRLTFNMEFPIYNNENENERVFYFMVEVYLKDNSNNRYNFAQFVFLSTVNEAMQDVVVEAECEWYLVRNVGNEFSVFGKSKAFVQYISRDNVRKSFLILERVTNSDFTTLDLMPETVTFEAELFRQLPSVTPIPVPNFPFTKMEKLN